MDGAEIESVEKALLMLIGVGPLPKLTLLEAESSVQSELKICGLVVKNDLPAGENAAGRWKAGQWGLGIANRQGGMSVLRK